VAEPTDAQTAGRFVQLADAACTDIIDRGGWPLLVGGTGLYHRAFVRGLAQIGPIPPDLRAELAAQHQQRGADAMYRELQRLDPTYAATTPASNRQRVLRALEVIRGTGRRLSDWHAEHKASGDRVPCLTAIVEPDRAWLTERIEARARAMVEPLLAEVERLLDEGLEPTAPAMQAIGYRDAVAVVQGRAPAEDLPQRLLSAHRKYAKRQQTWFRGTEAALRLERLDNAGLDRLARALSDWFLGA
jgi:tRNA dimethylallyltransferase